MTVKKKKRKDKINIRHGQTVPGILKTKDFYKDILDSIVSGVWVTDKNDVIHYTNKGMEKISGLLSEEIIGTRVLEDFPNDTSRFFGSHYRKAKKTLIPLYYDVVLIIDPAGRKSYRSGWLIPVIKDGSFDGMICTVEDVTERTRAEEKIEYAYQKLRETQKQLIQSSKMAAMGQLAAGISHELNQPLTGILGFAQAILADVDKDSPMGKDLEKIVHQAKRMDKIIQHVRFFSRSPDFNMKALDINQPVENSLALLNEQLKVHNIRVRKSLTKNLPLIWGDTHQLEQIFLNIITNARDAIKSLKGSGGGWLTVKTSLSKDKKNIEAIFKDTGCGISREDLDDIFNPFYTTKSTDGGMGLGLSIVYRIMENHKGTIKVDSRKGRGTAFKITLPVFIKGTKSCQGNRE